MSQRDIDQNHEIVRSFEGSRCFATLATNSIKFRIGDPDKKGRYIWIDPPWIFFHAGSEITSSETYSEDTFREWCKLFEPLRDTVLEKFTEDECASVTFIFSSGYRLLIPDHGIREKDSDYDHWYAVDSKI